MSPKINCIIVDDEPVAREILENHLEKITSIEVVASCKNAMEAFQTISSKSIDLVFLDINMPEISGLSLARSLNKNIKIIFTTAYREYAVEGFDLQAVDYLLKPISLERLLQGVNKYLNETFPIQPPRVYEAEEEKVDAFFVRADRKMVKISFDEILYIESVADYIKIYLTDKSVVTRETISNIEAKLPQQDFIRIHRSYIVARKYIDSYTSEYIEIGKKQLPISRGFKDQVTKKLES